MAQQQTVAEIPIESIRPNPYQPRTHFDQKKLQELADSIKESTLGQPITVRPLDGAGTYELVIGERRLRAFELLRRETIPAVIRQFTPEQSRELTLVENLQREDLTPIEEARGLMSLADHYGGNIAEVARKVGISAPTVSKKIALLSLPPELQEMIETGKVNVAQAEVILEIEEKERQIQAARVAYKLNLSANQLRGRMQQHLKKKREGSERKSDSVKFSHVSGTLVRLYDAIDKFDFNLLRDPNKRLTLRKQIELVQRTLKDAAEKLSEPIEE